MFMEVSRSLTPWLAVVHVSTCCRDEQLPAGCWLGGCYGAYSSSQFGMCLAKSRSLPAISFVIPNSFDNQILVPKAGSTVRFMMMNDQDNINCLLNHKWYQLWLRN